MASVSGATNGGCSLPPAAPLGTPLSDGGSSKKAVSAAAAALASLSTAPPAAGGAGASPAAASTDPIGLLNTGTDCWINTAIQLILSNEELTTYFRLVLKGRLDNLILKTKDNPHQEIILANSIERQCLQTLEMIQAQKANPGARSSCISIKVFKDYLVKLANNSEIFNLDPGRQFDAQEALIFLLNPSDVPLHLGEEMHSFQHSFERMPPSTEDCSPLSRARQASTSPLSPEVVETLEGKTNRLTLNLQEASTSFTALLHEEFGDRLIEKYSFTAEDDEGILEEDRKEFLYKGLKNSCFARPPTHLFVDLKRFAWNSEASITEKITTCFKDIPIEFSFPKEWSCSEEEDSFYLQAFAAHRGHTIESGHYLSYIKTEKGWFCCNDSTVTFVGGDADIAIILAKETTYSHLYCNKKKAFSVEGYEKSFDEVSLPTLSPSEITPKSSDFYRIIGGKFSEWIASFDSTEASRIIGSETLSDWINRTTQSLCELNEDAEKVKDLVFYYLSILWHQKTNIIYFEPTLLFDEYTITKLTTKETALTTIKEIFLEFSEYRLFIQTKEPTIILRWVLILYICVCCSKNQIPLDPIDVFEMLLMHYELILRDFESMEVEDIFASPPGSSVVQTVEPDAAASSDHESTSSPDDATSTTTELRCAKEEFKLFLGELSFAGIANEKIIEHLSQHVIQTLKRYVKFPNYLNSSLPTDITSWLEKDLLESCEGALCASGKTLSEITILISNAIYREFYFTEEERIKLCTRSHFFTILKNKILVFPAFPIFTFDSTTQPKILDWYNTIVLPILVHFKIKAPFGLEQILQYLKAHFEKSS